MTDTLLPPTISPTATCADLIVCLPQVIDRLDQLVDGVDADPSDHPEAGWYVYRAGKVAARLGFDDLALEAARIAPVIDAYVFGYETPACSPVSALAYIIRLQARCISTASHTGNISLTETKRSRPMAEAPLNSYRWFKAAENALGGKLTYRQAYKWANSHRGMRGMPDLDISLASFERNIRTAKAWVKRNGEPPDLFLAT